MSMNLEVEAVSIYQAQAAGSVLFPPPRRSDLVPRLREQDEFVPAAKVDCRLELPLDELSFHRLTTTAEIAQIMHLRGEIQLPAAALADPSFHTREKKETNME